jgi:hypothetical protein
MKINNYRIKILINSDIKANYIKRKLVLNMGIPLILKITSLTLLIVRQDLH